MDIKSQPAIVEKIKSYGKELKVSQEKLARFAADVLNAPIEKEQKILPTSKAIRAEILACKSEFVAVDLADRLGVTNVQVNNNLYSLQRKGLVAPTGEKRYTGTQGLPANIWKVLKQA